MPRRSRPTWLNEPDINVYRFRRTVILGEVVRWWGKFRAVCFYDNAWPSKVCDTLEEAKAWVEANSACEVAA